MSPELSTTARALEWLSARPAGAAKDNAIVTAAKFMSAHEPPEFLTSLLSSINDPARRSSAQFETYKLLRFHKNSAAADSWLDSLTLSDDVRQSWRAIASAGH